MRSGLIICKFAKLNIADNYLLEAVTTHSQAMGYALAKGGKILHETFPADEIDLLAKVQEVQEKYKEEQVYFHLTSAEENEFNFNSLQPIPLIEKGNEVLLAAMAEGEFMAYAKPGEDTPESLMIKEYLQEKVRKIFLDCGQNIDKTRIELEKPGFRADLKPLLLPRGVILMIPNKGKAFAYSDNKLFGEYEWGFASRTLGIAPPTKDTFKEPVKTDVKAAVLAAKPLTLREKQEQKKALEKAAADAAGAPIPVTPPVEPKKEETKEPDKKPVAAETYAIGKNEEGVDWCYPDKTWGYNQCKQWWNRNSSLKQPKDELLYEGFPAASLKAGSPMKAFYDKQQTATAVGLAMKKAQEQPAKATAAVDEVPSMMTADEKKELVLLKKNANYWGKKPEEIVNSVDATAMFSEQGQVPFEDMVTASIHWFTRLNKRQLILVAHEFRMKLMQEREAREAAIKAGAAAPSPEEIGQLNMKLESPASSPSRKLTLREKQALKAAKAA